ncbi:MAG: hypothetical protein D3908_16920, partial [Candidatus Electrothrix sp. AUS4]|nr:hypothetical protein [Candidatus Electrothrix sp. AUS4]
RRIDVLTDVLARYFFVGYSWYVLFPPRYRMAGRTINRSLLYPRRASQKKNRPPGKLTTPDQVNVL